jgi:MoaA/NifB/PqqE/SkfB family radical SAM enzyme
VNTLIAKENVHEIPYVLDLLLNIGVRNWELFLLIKTGRGVEMNDLSPWECEDILLFLYEISSEINVRTVEAPFIRKIALQGALTRGGLYIESLYPFICQEESPAGYCHALVRGESH